MTKWKVVNAFSAFSDYDNRPITVLQIYPLETDYFGDPFDLFLEPKELDFWKSHIGETFKSKENVDLNRFSSEQLRSLVREKVEWT